MKKLYYDSPGFENELRALADRPGYPPEIEPQVAAIIDDVRREGNAALVKYAAKFDRVELDPARFRVTDEEIDAAAALLSEREKKAIDTALSQVRDFALATVPRAWSASPRAGVMLGEKFTPMDRVGVYIPGGTAPLVSTVLHTAGIAGAAGVREIVAATPANREGKVHPAVLYAMRKAGVTEIYRLGGVYGVAALALGTESIRKVEKLVGPGNAYVTAAKKLLYGKVAIDMVAGPSEILVIADAEANPEFIAADLLSQAEHDKLASPVLVTDSADLAKAVQAELEVQIPQLPRAAIARASVDDNGKIIVCSDLRKAIEACNIIAPEHLEVCVDDPFSVLNEIKNAGSIFLGRNVPEALGDYFAGPNHTLPTSGTARFSSPLGVDDFVKKSSFIYYTREALEKAAPRIADFAEREGLHAHARSVTIRYE